jgi:type II secretory pathway pseudopilin PulG
MADPADRSAGFLLVEVLIALAILALVAGFAFRALSDAFGWLDRSHHAGVALALAQSTLDRVGSDIALNDGQINGRTADGYSWQVDIAPYQAAVPVSTPIAPYQVQVTVGWTTLGLPRQLQLTTVRLGYRERGT